MNISILGSKYLYKIFILTTKYISYLLAITQVLGIILCYYNIPHIWLSILGGCSIGIIFLLLLTSLVFKFCELHRIPIYYTISVYIIQIIDCSIGIPITNLMLYRIYFILTGLFVLVYCLCVYKFRNNPKIDHIKQLCERYNCNCK